MDEETQICLVCGLPQPVATMNNGYCLSCQENDDFMDIIAMGGFD
jgi:hypothetical protein